MPSSLRSITRLLIGSVLLGKDGLENKIKEWDYYAQGSDSVPEQEPTFDDEENNVSPGIEFNTRLDERSDLSYLLIGLAFKLQENIDNGVRKAEKMSGNVENLAKPILKPIYSSRFLKPFRTGFDNLVARGEAEVNRLVKEGQTEDAYSRTLAKEAFHERLDSSLDYLASEPKIEELIQSQSVSILDEIIEEVRERTVSADYLIEDFLRMIFRRPLRAELPTPPLELKRLLITTRIVKRRGTN